jgi:two-component system sensor histidine kinase ChvG
LDIAGKPGPQPSPDGRRGPRLASSLTLKLALLVGIFVALPVVLYGQFEKADRQTRSLVAETLRHRGWLIAQAVAPLLDHADSMTGPALNDQLEKLADDGTILKLMFQPTAKAGSGDFYFMASAPRLSAEQTGPSLDLLSQHGILQSLSASCSWDKPVEIRYQQKVSGAEEVLTSIVPITARQGCWVLISATDSSNILNTTYGKPFWQSDNIRMAAAIYVALVLLTILLLLNMRGTLKRFRMVARDIRQSGAGAATFASRNTLPELAGVAAEFDGMVDDMHRVANDIRRTAEDNAHSVKAPLAVIRSSLQTVKRSIAEDDQRGQRSTQLIESALLRLSSLVSTAQRLGNETADFIEAPRLRINMTSVVADGLRNARDISAEKNIRFVRHLEPNVHVLAPHGIMDVITENILDNAIGFSPKDSTITTTLKRSGRQIELKIEDEGPGIDPARLDHVFERHYSFRPIKEDPSDAPAPAHAGLGLWIVQRYAEALGGRVTASNRSTGGLCVTIMLPGNV